MKKNFGIALFLFVMTVSAFGQGNNYRQNYTKYQGLALTPPMGWNSWNKFQCNVDENLIKQIADAMVSTGMKNAGYTYINIDDCWHGERDSLGFIHPNAQRFPSGMKALSDYVHLKGLKLGIYSDAGSMTCGGKPGSRGYEFQDAQMYAKWGIDYLKYDWCNTEGLKAEGAYKTIAAALQKAERSIVLSLCEWGQSNPWTWASNVGHLWRSTGDITNQWEGVKSMGTWRALSVMKILESQDTLRKYAGPGHWNDPDMLEVGNGMPVNEDRAHFSMWAMIAAPLIAGNDIRKMSKETAEILMNKEIIAINQDSMGVQGFKYAVKDSFETWLKPLKGGDWAIAFLNRNSKPKQVDFNWQNEVINDALSKATLDAKRTTYKVRDLWSRKDEGDTKKSFKATVPPHDVVVLRLTKK
ncbi:MAG: alpha-galactosidase [Segetibacter sp.]|jgi:alpha-galactosidase|nr:alpha-galactosidase [Segetibacter sp.]